MKYIEDHPEDPWMFDQVSFNPNLNAEFLVKYPNYEYNWEYMS